MHNLADCLAGLGGEGAVAEAKEVYRRCVRLQSKVLGPTSEATLHTVTSLAELHERMAEHGEAEPLLRQAYEARRDRLGADHHGTMASFQALCDCLLLQVGQGVWIRSPFK